MNLRLSRRSFGQCLIAAVLAPSALQAAEPVVTVHKDPTCDCCGGWVKHLEASGFRTKVIETADINRVKSRLGIPSELAACHTAEVAGYLLEGHVPAATIRRLLSDRPQAKGLAVPGMPGGSPGMGGDAEEYDVILFGPGERRVYARFKGEQPI